MSADGLCEAYQLGPARCLCAREGRVAWGVWNLWRSLGMIWPRLPARQLSAAVSTRVDRGGCCRNSDGGFGKGEAGGLPPLLLVHSDKLRAARSLTVLPLAANKKSEG